MNEKVNQLFSLDGKVALITGATHGIGFQIALALAGAGARICFNSRYEKSIQRAMEDYQKHQIDAKGYICDVTDPKQVAAMIRQIHTDLGPVDILVNNAGIIERKPMLEMEAAEFEQVVRTDLTGPFIVSKAVLPDMIRSGHGKIINICSLLSEVGRETVAGYAAAKGGLKILTKNICAEFGACNIQCNGIGPGYIATEQTAPMRQPQSDGRISRFTRYLEARTPAGRWGTVQDLEGPAVFLASAASDFVNGQILYVDGGLLASFGRTPQ